MKRTSSGQDLLYVANLVTQDVNVYTYPQGQLAGTLTGFTDPLGECVDADGDVFVVASADSSSTRHSVIYEFAHGGTNPIATLSDPTPGEGCAIDPNSGNLAVVGGHMSGVYSYGDAAIFADAQGNPTMYYSKTFEPFHLCGYDSRGNLYTSANIQAYNQEALVSLPANGKQFKGISLDATLYGNDDFPSSVQWDGKYVTVSSATTKGSYMYRLTISGKAAKIVGTTILTTRHNDVRSGQILIDGNHVLASDVGRGGGGIDAWSYPNAGKKHSVVGKGPNFAPFGIVISPAVSTLKTPASR